jgi:hypothetical protein
MTTATGETTTTASTRAFVDAMITHNTQVRAEIEQAAASLATAGISGPVLDGLHELARHYAGARGRWDAMSDALKQHEALAQQARATDGIAVDTAFYTDDTGAAGGAGWEEIRPQWPGHKPPRRWEWMVRAHLPGDRQHVQQGLPSVDLASEQALLAYVQDALRRYDWVQLHHWYTGSELTFTRQADGSVTVTRQQLNPTAGAPGHRRDF